MNGFEKLISLKMQLSALIEGLEGREIQYKGEDGTVMYVHLDGTVTLYLEDAEGNGREVDLTWAELAKNAK